MLLRRIGMIVIPSVEHDLSQNVFVVGKHGIGYVDPSFKERCWGRSIAAQERRCLVQSELMKPKLVRAIGPVLAKDTRKVFLADILGTIQSGVMEGAVRYFFFVGENLIRIDRILGHYNLHAFSVDVPGEIRVKMRLISRA